MRLSAIPVMWSIRHRHGKALRNLSDVVQYKNDRICLQIQTDVHINVKRRPTTLRNIAQVSVTWLIHKWEVKQNRIKEALNCVIKS